MMWRMARPYLPEAMLAILGLVLFYAALVRMIASWRRRQKLARQQSDSSTAAGFRLRSNLGWSYGIASFLALGFLGLVNALPDIVRCQSVWRLAAILPGVEL